MCVCDTRAVFGNNWGVTPEGMALCISQHGNYSEMIFGEGVYRAGDTSVHTSINANTAVSF